MSKNYSKPVKQNQNPKLSLTAASYSGPLPLPQDFERYEIVLPGAADRILKMAEKEQDARVKYKQTEHNDMVKIYKNGQAYGFTIGIVGLLISGVLLFFEKNIQGASTLILSIGVLASKTVWDMIRQKKMEKKNQQQ